MLSWRAAIAQMTINKSLGSEVHARLWSSLRRRVPLLQAKQNDKYVSFTINRLHQIAENEIEPRAHAIMLTVFKSHQERYSRELLYKGLRRSFKHLGAVITWTDDYCKSKSCIFYNSPDSEAQTGTVK